MALFTITKSIFFGMALILLFLSLNNPFAEIQGLAEFNLFMMASAGMLVILPSSKQTWYEIKDSKELINSYAVGLIIGVFGWFVINFMVQATSGVYNLLGTVSGQMLSAVDSTQLAFVAIIFPLTETIILVGGTLFLANFLKGRIPFNKVVAGLAIILLFSGFHFNDRNDGQFEYSISGFVNFIGNVEGIGQPDYVGAFPQLLLGAFWVLMALSFKNWVVAWSAHSVSNLLSLFIIFGPEPFIFILGAVYVGITLIVLQRGGFKFFNKFDLKGVLKSG